MHKSFYFTVLAFATTVATTQITHAQPAGDPQPQAPKPPPPSLPIDCANPPNGEHDVFFRGVIRPVRTPSGEAAYLATAGVGLDKPWGHRARIVFSNLADPWTFKVAEDNWAKHGDTARTITDNRTPATEAAARKAPYGKIKERQFWSCYCATHAHMATYTNGKYPSTPSATGTSSAADGYGLPVTGARAPTSANPNGLSNCEEFQAKLGECLFANGATVHTPP